MKLFVPADDAVASFDLRFRRVTLAALAGDLDERAALLLVFCFS